MSEQSIPLNTGKQMIVNTDHSNIFIGNNRYQEGNYLNNSSYDDLAVVAGTLLGRIGSSNKLIPSHPLSTDGSQYPVGVLAHDIEIDSASEAEVTMCDGGDVAEEKIVMLYGGALTDTVGGRTIKDLLAAQGIKLVAGTELTDYDNQ